MTAIVPRSDIERIVGVPRDPRRHLGRAVSEEQTIYIMHSKMCLASGIDLRICSYSRLLDELMKFDEHRWVGWEDKPVVLGIDRDGLIPARLVLDDPR